MISIGLLEDAYFQLKLGVGNPAVCVDWAMQRLSLDQEGDDLEIVLLAGAKGPDVLPLAEQIVVRYLGEDRREDQLAVGKLIVSLRDAYLCGDETIESLDSTFMSLFSRLDYPDWSVMLARNCEYATDVGPFRGPFEAELTYIANLWASVRCLSEFEAIYERSVSNSHDLPGS